MATCAVCARNLPPNGKCFYCGDIPRMREGEHRKQSGLAVLIGKLFKLVIVLAILGGIAFLALTESGRGIVKKLANAVGIGGEAELSGPPAVVLCKKEAPGLRKLFATRPGAVKYNLDELKDGTVIVKFYYQESGTMVEGSFSVELDAEFVTALDDQAESWME